MKANRAKVAMMFTVHTLLTAICFAAAVNAQVSIQEIRGVIKDEHGAVIVDAIVTLTRDGERARTTRSDAQGRFGFIGLQSRDYAIKVEAKGFAAYEQLLNMQSLRSEPFTITLYPTVKETVVVDADAADAAMDPERAAGTLILKERDIAALPDDPDELYGRLQLMAASSGGVPGGATVTVDGFIVHGRLPSKGSIREIRINPDLYSAEYDKAPYRGGRIEILTKPGAEAFHGSAFFSFNDSALNARNAFALTRPPSRTRRYGIDFGGPIVPRKSGFYINLERRDIDEANIINALVLNSAFQPVSLSQNVPAPSRLTIGSLRLDWQTDVNNTLIGRFDFNKTQLSNQGIGGFNLADRGFATSAIENTIRVTDTTVFGATMVNEARLGITAIHITEQAASNAPAILVPGAFFSGGASAQSQLSRDLHLEFADNFSLVAGKHKLKLGAQVFGKLSHDNRTDNFNGTFVFGGGSAPQLDASNQIVTGPAGPVLVSISGLEQYRRTLLGLPGGVPTRFAITTGDPSAHVNQWLFSAFAQDEWKFRRNIAVSMGLRYEGQTNPTDKFSIAPRFGIAYSVDRKQHWVLRVHAGLFYSRIPDSVAFDLERLDGIREQQILINNPPFPNPFVGGNSSTTIPTIRALQAGINPEASWQGQIALEHQLPHGWKVNFSESYSAGRSVLRSLNINAPIVIGSADPLTAPRPLGINENILEYQSTGVTRGPVTFAGINQTGNRRFTLFAGYLYFGLRSNADTPVTQPQSSFSQAGEMARPFWESAHRVFMAGTVYLPWMLRASPSLSAASGTPFNITTGIDNNGDGSFTDRPGIVESNTPGALLTRFGSLTPAAINGTVPRNVGTNPATITLDMDVSRDFAFAGAAGSANGLKDGRYKLTVNVRSSNLLNRVNVTGLNGVLTSPFFDRANSAGPARRIEFGARFSF